MRNWRLGSRFEILETIFESLGSGFKCLGSTFEICKWSL